MTTRTELEIDLWERSRLAEQSARTLLSARRSTVSRWPEADALKTALDALHSAREALREHLLVGADDTTTAALAEAPDPPALTAGMVGFLRCCVDDGSASTPNGSPEAATAVSLSALGYLTEAASGDDYIVWTVTAAGRARTAPGME